MSITDRVLDALKSAVQLEMRVSSLANGVSELSRDLRDVDKRLIRVETVLEFATRSGFQRAEGLPKAIEDQGT